MIICYGNTYEPADPWYSRGGFTELGVWGGLGKARRAKRKSINGRKRITHNKEVSNKRGQVCRERETYQWTLRRRAIRNWLWRLTSIEVQIYLFIYFLISNAVERIKVLKRLLDDLKRSFVRVEICCFISFVSHFVLWKRPEVDQPLGLGSLDSASARTTYFD